LGKQLEKALPAEKGTMKWRQLLGISVGIKQLTNRIERNVRDEAKITKKRKKIAYCLVTSAAGKQCVPFESKSL